MTTEQILLYAVIALVIYYVGKKIYLIKSIKQYSPADALAKVKKERNVVFLDVRTEKERKQNSIKGSYHIPVTYIKDREQELKKFKDAEIIWKWAKLILPVVGGAIAGYSYYYYVGCNGSCPISGNPYISTAYGAFAGFLFIDWKSLFNKNNNLTEKGNK